MVHFGGIMLEVMRETSDRQHPASSELLLVTETLQWSCVLFGLELM